MERSLYIAMSQLSDPLRTQVAVDEFCKWTRSITNGDEKAFTEFFDQWSCRVFNFLLKHTRGETGLAQEIHQITMIKAARKFRPFSTEAELWCWLRTIARNSFLDHLRREDVFRKTLALVNEGPLSDDSQNEKQDLLCALELAIRECTPEETRLINAFYQQGLTHKELATELSTTPKAVERRLAKLRDSLRRRMIKGET